MMEINFDKIGERIAETRKANKVKQKDLANVLGITSKYLSNIETGRRRITLENLSILCNYFDVTPDYFVLGAIKDDIDGDIIDRLKNCSDENKQVIYELVKILSLKNMEKQEEEKKED